MSFNIVTAQRTADRQIRKFGTSAKAPGAVGALVVIEGGAQRACIVGIVDYKPYERGLVEEGAVRALISYFDPNGVALDPPPHHQTDKLLCAGSWYNFVAPIAGPRPGGVPVFYDCQVVYDSTA